MTRHFNSLESFTAMLTRQVVAMPLALESGLERVARKVEATAKSEFGTYQPSTGPFPAWAELAESTQDERERLGFTPNDPLLRTGDLKDSIGHEVDGMEAIIGSKSEVMVFHEFGTAKMPPRPVLGPAAARNKEAIENILGAAFVGGLIGSEAIHPSLGYDFETSD